MEAEAPTSDWPFCSVLDASWPSPIDIGKLCVGYYLVVLLPGLLLELFFSFGLALEFEAGETETTT
jgi:hypothetical protein